MAKKKEEAEVLSMDKEFQSLLRAAVRNIDKSKKPLVFIGVCVRPSDRDGVDSRISTIQVMSDGIQEVEGFRVTRALTIALPAFVRQLLGIIGANVRRPGTRELVKQLIRATMFEALSNKEVAVSFDFLLKDASSAKGAEEEFESAPAKGHA